MNMSVGGPSEAEYAWFGRQESNLIQFLKDQNQTLGPNPKQIYTGQQQQREVDLGVDPIPICRPRFIYFKFTGLRPNAQHFFFCDDVNVSSYVNTSAGVITNFNNGQSTGSVWKDPGERYINSTGFPTDLGGATSPLVSDSTGTLEGVFYLQRNTTLFFETGQLTINVCDISTNKKEDALSYASTTYVASGVINYNYTDIFTTAVLVNNPNYVAPSNAGTTGTVGNRNNVKDNGPDHDFSPPTGNYSDPPGNVVSRALDAITGQTPGKGSYSNSRVGDVDRSGGPSKGDGCVIATHAMSSGSFSRLDRAKAIAWCEKNWHGKWWGEVLRKGYRILGRNKINAGEADKYYDDFKNFVDYGRGKNKSLRNGIKYYSYIVRFFLAGLFLKEQK